MKEKRTKKPYKIHPNSLKNLKLPKDYSFTQTPEYKEKMRKKSTGRKVSDYTRALISKAHKGKKRSDLIRLQQSERMKDSPYGFQKGNQINKGRVPWNKGIPMKEEQKEKLRKAWDYDKHITPAIRKKFRDNWKKLWNTNPKWVEAQLNKIVPSKDTKPERMMQIALALNGIKFEKHKAISGRPDMFIEPNICVFVDGDFHHANPSKYKYDTIIWKKYGIVKASDIWAYDNTINHKLSLLGYFVIRLWTSDIKKNTQGCAEKIIHMIKELKESRLP